MNNPVVKWLAQESHPLAFLLVLQLSCTTPLFAHAQKGYLYLSPSPGALRVSPRATILFRLHKASPRDIVNLTSCVAISGSLSAEHATRTHIAADGTIICIPEPPFCPGERVAVKLKPEWAPGMAGAESFEYIFHVSATAPATEKAVDAEIGRTNANTGLSNPSMVRTAAQADALMRPNGVSVPANFPDFTLTIARQACSDPLFLSTAGRDNFVMILDGNGDPVWYLDTSYPRHDFKVQLNGLLTMHLQKEEGRSFGSGFIALDRTFTEIDSFCAAGGYETDYHELQLLEDGHYLLFGVREERVDLSHYFPGGNPDARVEESAIQEFSKDGDLIFLWRAWDHFHIADMEIEDISLPSLRFPHMNALDIDEDGHLLLSSRHLGEITKINRQTGDIIWRLGGAHNQFAFVDDPLGGFSGQHDIRALGGGRYLLFDNGNLHQPPLSRAVEYELDTEKMTATLIWEHRDRPDKYAAWMGNAQRLANGNTLINWSRQHLAKPVEVNPAGDKVFEIEWADQVNCYRMFRFDWQGVARQPYLIAEHYDDHITLLFNKFGDADVNFYRIYAGEGPQPTTLLDTSAVTQKDIYDLPDRRQYYFRVTAMTDGRESPFSNEESLFVNYTTPGENMVLNADFAGGLDHWLFSVSGDAQADAVVNSEEQCCFHIQNGGREVQNIQLRQPHLKLVRGRDYLFEFDASASDNRLIEAYLTRESDAGVNYGRIGPTAVSRRMQHVACSFTMSSPSDHRAVALFNVGSSDVDVTIDNVSLTEQMVSFAKERSARDLQLDGIHPNPFNQEARICYRLANQARLCLKIYNVNGQCIQTLIDDMQDAGPHQVIWDGRNQAGSPAPSGVYLCRLDLKWEGGHRAELQKMTLLK
ncbi:aryl-sulfate sulfotransferase [candidate division KSB1 bacterium]|nr:aryl-sulfate sulfotransferase [candidate division KSB1 bacterium]